MKTGSNETKSQWYLSHAVRKKKKRASKLPLEPVEMQIKQKIYWTFQSCMLNLSSVLKRKNIDSSITYKQLDRLLNWCAKDAWRCRNVLFVYYYLFTDKPVQWGVFIPCTGFDSVSGEFWNKYCKWNERQKLNIASTASVQSRSKITCED